MTTSRQRAQTLALDIVKKQDGGAVFARELMVLMREYNGQTSSVRNRERNDRRSRRALICARAAGPLTSWNLGSRPRVMLSEVRKSDRRKTKTEPLPLPQIATFS